MMYLHFAQQIQEKQITILKLSNNNQDNHVSLFFIFLSCFNYFTCPLIFVLPQLVKSRR